MGEANRKSRKLRNIVANESRCIYCDRRPSTIEHMPPRNMFVGKARPSGLEFAACNSCNSGTTGADLVASFLARVSPENGHLDLFREGMHWASTIDQKAPGFRAELLRTDKQRRVLTRTRAGILVPAISINADGPITTGYLAAFGGKLGMALYREHIGEPLPQDGRVHVMHFLNAGLNEDQAQAMLAMLPLHDTLKQGKFTVPEQFAYRYNTDQKGILAALVHFHSNLRFFLIAHSSDYDLSSIPMMPHSVEVLLGEPQIICADLRILSNEFQ